MIVDRKHLSLLVMNAFIIEGNVGLMMMTAPNSHAGKEREKKGEYGRI